jgi:hypothetical protein
MMDFTGAPHVGTRPHTPERVEPLGFAPLTNLGFTPQAGTIPTAETFMDRHVDLARLIADPTAVLLTAFTQWTAATQDHQVEAIALVQVMDLHYGGQTAEGLTTAQTLRLAQLLRHDAELRTAGRPIPTAAGTGAQR